MKIVVGRPYKSSELGLDDPDGVLWGVYVGGCIDERSSWQIWHNTRSHSHDHKTDPFQGWICILKPTDVLTPKGKITNTFAHELAHLMAPGSRHSRAWKRALVKMGYASEIAACGYKPL